MSLDQAVLQQCLQVCNNAHSASNEVQLQVTQAIQVLSQNPTYPMYLTHIFAQMGDQPVMTRQTAGLLLKKQVDQAFATIQQEMWPPIKTHILDAVVDKNETIRKTAGSIITTVMTKGGVWVEALQKLAEAIGHADTNVVDGALGALDKICEDTLEGYPGADNPFIQFTGPHLVPKLFQICDMSVPVHFRRQGMKILNHFALHYVFDAKQPLAQYLGQYKALLGVLAVQDSDAEVLQHTVKGLVHLVDQCPEQLAGGQSGPVLQMLLKACQHEDYDVRYYSLEVWALAVNQEAYYEPVRQLLPELVPTLLQNMIYSKYDYETMDAAMVEEDNMAVPDTEVDVAPRFHEGRNDDAGGEDDDEGGGGSSAWGTDWTVRKGAAASLDCLSNTYRSEVLPHLLPRIETALKSPNWEQQEAAVLAVGAIAHGCLYDLAPHLPNVMNLLLQMCSAQKPLLRSISCWTVSRYSSWICHPENAVQFLAPALQQLLTHMLDKNKRVQEASCSAFATLEEEARQKLIPFLPDILGKLIQAYKVYQAKNLLILYDATGTLAEAVAGALDEPQFTQQLLPALFQRFTSTADHDRSLVALFECLTQLGHHTPKGLYPYRQNLLSRCVRLIKNSLDQYQMSVQSPESVEAPDREILASSIDAIAGMVAGLGEGVLETVRADEANCGFVQLIPICCAVEMVQVKQASFALLGDLAKNLPQGLAPQSLGSLIAACGDHLTHGAPAVANNASWAIGEICVKAGEETMRPYVERLVTLLIQTLHNSANARAQVLVQNTCITIARLALVSSQQIGPLFPQFAEQWCMAMITARNDAEKNNAFKGVCLLIQANAQVMMEGRIFYWFLKSVASFYQDSQWSQPPAPEVKTMLSQVLNGYKGSHAATWGQIWQQLEQPERQRLTELYGLTA
jgi:transportin-1